MLADFWFSSGSREGNQFITRYQPIAEELKESVSFVPHYHIISLAHGEQDTTQLCLDADKKFCAADPDGPGPSTGKCG